MSVIIKYMDLPKGCEYCELSYVDDDVNRHCCYTNSCVNGFYSERANNCPLEEVGDPDV